MLFLIGIITSYEDFKYGLVRNRWIKLGIYWGLGVLILLFIWNFFALQATEFYAHNFLNLTADSGLPVFTVHQSFFRDTIINIFFATLIGFTMWRLKSWAAGDAKLFIVYSLLIPIPNYWKTFFPIFPSIALLINIFVVILIYVCLKSFYLCLLSLYNIIKQKKIGSSKKINLEKIQHYFFEFIKNIENSKMIFLFVFLIIFIFAIFQKSLQQYFNFDLFYLQIFIFALIIIFSDSFVDVLKNKIVIITILFSLILFTGYGFLVDFISTILMLINTSVIMILFMFIFSLFQSAMDYYIKKTAVKYIDIGKLTINVLPTEEQLKKIGDIGMGEIGLRGINREQLEKIKKFANKNKMTKIEICKFAPFSMWIFVGVLLTLLLRGSLLGIFFSF
jgi:hypothetical protein